VLRAYKERKVQRRSVYRVLKELKEPRVHKALRARRVFKVRKALLQQALRV
jgi:hypothetical protein